MSETIKIELPESIADITLEQYQKFTVLQEKADTLSDQGMAERVISLFTGIRKQDVKNLVISDYELIMNQITEACNTPVKFQQRFELNGVEYGMIPNLNEISQGEYIDLTTLGSDMDEMNKVMAILFRPVTKVDAFGNYSIEAYGDITERSDIMLGCPMHIVNGSLLFFLNLSKDSSDFILKYIQEEDQKKKLQDTLLNGDGTQR